MPNLLATLFPSIWKECTLNAHSPRAKRVYSNVVEGQWEVTHSGAVYELPALKDDQRYPPPEPSLWTDTTSNPVWVPNTQAVTENWARYGMKIPPADDYFAAVWASWPNIIIRPNDRRTEGKQRTFSFASTATQSTEPPVTPKNVAAQQPHMPCAASTTKASGKGKHNKNKCQLGRDASQRAPQQDEWAAMVRERLILERKQEEERAALQDSWANFVRGTLIPARNAGRLSSGELNAPPPPPPPNVKPHMLRLRVKPPPPLNMELIREEEAYEDRERDYVIVAEDED